MATYTARPTSAGQFLQWSDPASWSEGSVPNSSDATVIDPIVYQGSGTSTIGYFLQINPSQTFAAGSVTLNSDLLVYGTLNVSGAIIDNGKVNGSAGNGELDIEGGTVTAQSLSNYGIGLQGRGQLTVVDLDNETSIIGSGLTINATSLHGGGTLYAGNGALTLNVTPGGFAYMSGGSLTSGTLTAASSGTLALNVGSLLTTIAGGSVVLTGGSITSMASASSTATPLTTSLNLIGSSGSMTLGAGSYAFGALEVAGKLLLQPSTNTAPTLSSSALKVDVGGQISGHAILQGNIVNDGTITATIDSGSTSSGSSLQTLLINGNVSGAGTLAIGVPSTMYTQGRQLYYPATLELNGTVSENVAFQSDHGTLKLDQPGQFTGTIQTTGSSDTIVLANVSQSAITNTSYTGDANGGTLTISQGSASLSLKFSGYHVLSDFAFSTPSQSLSTAPLLQITVAANTAPVTPVITTTTLQVSTSTTSYNWDNPTVWQGGTIPTANNDVVLPVVTYASGSPFSYNVNIASGESYAVHSLTGSLIIRGGSLTASQSITGNLSLFGGTVTAGSIVGSITGAGQVTTGDFQNDTYLSAATGTLTVNTQTFHGSGALFATGGDFALHTAAGGFADMTGNTLTAGSITAAQGYNVALDVGAAITGLATSVTLAGGSTITSVDPTTGQAVAITSSLHTIASAGSLTIASGSYSFGALDVSGAIHLGGTNDILAGASRSLIATGLTVEGGGQVEGFGTIQGAIRNDGTIISPIDTTTGNDIYGTLLLSGTVTGSGSLVIGAQKVINTDSSLTYERATLELNGTVSENVIFQSRGGTLQLDQPNQFTGAIQTVETGDQILLKGITASAVTGMTYTTTATGGTLTIYEGGTSQSLAFLGDHVLGDFTLTTQAPTLSTDPSYLVITVRGATPMTLTGSAGSDTLVGGRGNDYIDGGAGVPAVPRNQVIVDTMIGGPGDDTYVVNHVGDIVTELPGEGNDLVLASVSYTLPDNVERLTLTGTANTSATGNALDNTITGNSGNNILSGGAGNDVFYTGGGRDIVDGGAGTDTLVLQGTRASYAVFTIGANTYIIGASEGVLATNVETVQFADTSASWSSILATAQPFDATSYLAKYPDLAKAFGSDTTAAAAHFVSNGFAEGRVAGAFSPLEYLASNPDLIRAFGLNTALAAQHYQSNGIAEHRATASFDPYEYIASNPDLIKAFGANAVAGETHYITNGLAEGRSTTSFNALEYIASNPDLIAAFGDDTTAAEIHYDTNGYYEHRNIASFDALKYIASYGDLIKAFGVDTVAATEHYIDTGYAEGRTASFDALAYAASSPDLAAIYGTNQAGAEAHYIQFGYAEGRPTSGFDAVAYALTYQDLGQAGLTIDQDFMHWLTNGAKEGRVGDALYGREQTNHNAPVGATTHDTLGTTTDHDWFQVTLTAGQSIDISLAATKFDPLLQIFDDHGVQQTQVQGAATGSTATLTFTAAHAGVYYIGASATDAHTGDYDLTLHNHGT